MTGQQRTFRIGQSFTLSDTALENYGEQYRGVIYHVRQWFDHHCSVLEIETDPHGHPGWDGSDEFDCLYEAVETTTPFGALYDYEMEPVGRKTRRKKEDV